MTRKTTKNRTSTTPSGARGLRRRGPCPLALEQRFMFDGAAASDAINVLAVNEAPVLDLNDTSETFAEGVSGGVLFGSGSITDTDSANLNGGILRVGGLTAGDTVSIATGTANTAGAIRLAANGYDVELGNGSTWSVIGRLDTSAGTDIDITFTSDLVTPTVAQSVLRALVFSNSSDAPPTSRTLTVSVSDGDGGFSAEDTLQVNVTTANDAPVIEDPATAFVVGVTRNNAAPVNGTASGFLVSELFKTARISDPDGTGAGSLGIAITSVNTTKVDGVYYSTDGGANWTVISLTAGQVLLLANDANTRIAIDQKTGGNATNVDANGNPNGVLTFLAWDKSQGAAGTTVSASGLGTALSTASASSVNIRDTAPANAVYRAPVNTLPSTAPSGSEGAGITLTGFSIADSGTIGAGTTYTVRFIVSAGHIDGTSSGGVTVTGGGAGNPAITLSGTLANINTYLGGSNLTFQPEQDFTGTVTLTMVTTDPDGLVDGDSTTITVNAVNDAPRLDLNGGATGSDVVEDLEGTATLGATVSFIEDGGPVAIVPVAALWDVDSTYLSSITATLTARPDGGSEVLGLNASAQAAATAAGVSVSYSAGTLTISDSSGTVTAATFETILRGITYDNTDETPTTGLRTIAVVASDGTANSLTRNAQVDVGGGNDAPVVDTPIADQTATARLPILFSVAGTFSDPDGDTLTYTAQLKTGASLGALPTWLTFDADTQTFSGTPPAAGTYTVRVTAEDPDGLEAFDEFDIVAGTQFNGQDVVAVPFAQVYELVDSPDASGYYGEETSSFNTGDLLPGGSFTFYQFASSEFTGNNVPGFLRYIDDTGTVTTIEGVVSRPVKTTGNAVQGFYFWVNNGTAGNITDDTAYLLVVRTGDFEPNQTGGSKGAYGSSSDRVDTALNAYLNGAPSVSDVTVNEGSNNVVFTVAGASGSAITLALVEGSGAGFADINETQTLQYYNTATSQWVNYNGTSVTLPASGMLMVRVNITAEQDTVYEMGETFKLAVQRLGVGTPVVGTATILDDGTGNYWIGDATDPATPEELENDNISLDDDRNPVAEDNDYTVVAGETVTGNIITDDGNGDEEGGVDSDPAGRDLTVAEVEGTAFDDLDDSTSLDYPTADGWKQVTLDKGTLYIKADGSFAYVSTGGGGLDDFTYKVSNGNNASLTAATVSFDVDNGNEAPEFTAEEGEDGEDLTETDTTLTATGSIALTDVDSASVTVDVTDLVVSTTFPGGTGALPDALTADDYQALKDMFSIVVTPAVQVAGPVASYSATVDWTFESGDADDLAFDFLAEGETLTLVYTIEADDGEDTGTIEVTILITGTNDTPDLSSESKSLNETNAGLNITGSVTVVDVDVTDTASVELDSVTVVRQGSSSGGSLPSNLTADDYALVKAMLSLGTPNQDVDADPTDGTTVDWTFNSGEAFDFLRGGEKLVITFVLKATDSRGELPIVPATAGEDGSSTNTITITVNGSNDLPTSTNDEVRTNQDTPVVLRVADFGTFSDPDSSMGGVVLQLPGLGKLQFQASASNWQDISAGRFVSVTELNQGRLRYVPGTGGSGDGYTSIGFKVQDLAGAQSESSYTLTVNVTPAAQATNTAPTSTNDSVTMNEDTSRMLVTSDFGAFSDVDGDTMKAVKITQLPGAGRLQVFNGSTWVDATTNQTIAAADLVNTGTASNPKSNVRFVPAANAWGLGYATAQFKVVDGRDAESTSAYALRFDVREVSDSTPTSTNDSRTVVSGSTTALGRSDFGTYSDGVDGDTFSKVRITSLPSTGQLRLLSSTGSSSAVSNNQEISRAILDAGRLVYVATSTVGGYNTTVGFRVSDGTNLSPTPAYTLTISVAGSGAILPVSTASVDERSTSTTTTGSWDSGTGLPATGGRSSLTEQIRKVLALSPWLSR